MNLKYSKDYLTENPHAKAIRQPIEIFERTNLEKVKVKDNTALKLKFMPG